MAPYYFSDHGLYFSRSFLMYTHHNTYPKFYFPLPHHPIYHLCFMAFLSLCQLQHIWVYKQYSHAHTHPPVLHVYSGPQTFTNTFSLFCCLLVFFSPSWILDFLKSCISFWEAPLLTFICIVLLVQSSSCVQLCDPVDFSTPGLPVPHHLPKFAQVHVHCFCDGIQHLIL